MAASRCPRQHDRHDVAEVEPGVAEVGWERSCEYVSAAAEGEGGGVAPGLNGLVQYRDAVGGGDGEPPMRVQQELEASGGAQVDQIIEKGEELPTLRLTHDVAATPLELGVLKNSVANFEDPAKAMGVEISSDEAGVRGPALWVEPIAIYR